jgi:hypothetical protein
MDEFISPMLNLFKKLVDENNATIAAFADDHRKVAEFLGIDTSNGFGGSQITDRIAEAINLNIQSSDEAKGFDRKKFRKIAQELIYRHVLYGDEVNEYLKVFSAIGECLESSVTKIKSLENPTSWNIVIQQAKNYCLYRRMHSHVDIHSIRRDYPRDVDTALAIKLLLENGASVAIVDSEFELSELEGVVRKIEGFISRVGGISFAKVLFGNLLSKKIYNNDFERYLINRNTNLMAFSSPMFPYGYALNLCAKYPAENQSRASANDYKSVENLLTAIATSYGSQPYSFWEVNFHAGDRLVELLQNTALFDSIFTINQAKPAYVLAQMKSLFTWVDQAKFEAIIDFTLIEYHEVCSIIFDVSKTFAGPVTIYQSKICSLLKHIQIDRVSKILATLSHDSVNSEYNIPSDFAKADFLFKPLIRIGPTKFVLMDKSWCAPGAYEALFAIINLKVYPSKKNDLVSGKLGASFENLVYERLTLSNITFSEGEYEGGECDLIIESPKAVILIELKRKVLTRQAKSGIDISLLLDIADSIFEAQFQLGRTHLLLKKNGYIDLQDRNGKRIRVNLNGRDIERVALSSVEFGGFHDRTIVEQILRAFSTHSYSTTSEEPQIKSKFEKFNLKQSEWNKQVEELTSVDTSFAHRPFWNCSFLSFFQLITVLEDSSDNESFYSNLFSTKYVTTGTFDFYSEYARKKLAKKK